MSSKNSNTKRLKSVYDLFHFKQQIRDYTRIASQTNRNGKKIVTKASLTTLEQTKKNTS